jgi:SAM-dependent methyltransferase
MDGTETKVDGVAVSDAVRIDLGCGNAKRPGFVGLDLFPGEQVDHVLDLTADPYPFADDSVDEVFSAHFLEHIEEPNHVFGEIGRVCKDGARIQFWTPYAWTNEAFLYGHLHAITEEMWTHLGVTHRDLYSAMLRGHWLLRRFIFVIQPATIADLERRGVDLDFAVRYLKGVVHEFGVEAEFRRDLATPVVFPEWVYATERFGRRIPLAPGASSGSPLRQSPQWRRALGKVKRKLVR